MANLLFDHPGLWRDGNGFQPPAAWTGVAYEFVDATSGDLYYQGTPAAGDTVSCPVSWSGGTGPYFTVCGGNDAINGNWPGAVRDNGQPSGAGSFTFTFSGGETGVYMYTSPGASYEGTVVWGTLPAPTSGFWTDLVGVAYATTS